MIRCVLVLLLVLASFHEQEVTFMWRSDVLYGSLRLPERSGGPVPGVLIIAGSGPTDRDGNSPLASGRIDNLKHFAEVLAEAGVASLRYDKIYSGKTGPVSRTVSFEDYLEPAAAAYAYLRSRPEIDPERLMILGHSEGALIALVLAEQRKPEGLRGLILAAPLSEPYLKTMRDQLSRKIPAEQLAVVDQVLLELRTEGTVLSFEKLSPGLQRLFHPANNRFLASVAPYDPAQLASMLSPHLPVLVLSALKDVQVTPPMVDHLMQGFFRAGNTRVRLVQVPDANHVFREHEGVDYTQGEFSEKADEAVKEFMQILTATSVRS